MTGGDLSAVLGSLSGLGFGNALLSALGLREQTDARCFIGDLALRHGVVGTQTPMLDPGVAIVRSGGMVDLRD